MTTSPAPSHIRRLKRIAPLQLGKVLAIVYGLLSLFLIPLVVYLLQETPVDEREGILTWGVGLAFAVPVAYAIIGFISGLLGALVYNLIAKFIGGIVVEVE